MNCITCTLMVATISGSGLLQLVLQLAAGGGGSLTTSGPRMKPSALPVSSRSQERPVATVRWPGGNQRLLTMEGSVTTKGPMLPFRTPPQITAS